MAPRLPEERVKIGWVTIDRFCQEEADGKEDVRRELERTGRPLRSSAGSLSDDELLAKLRILAWTSAVRFDRRRRDAG